MPDERCLREALTLLNDYRDSLDDPAGLPYYAATNVLLVEIANREGKSIDTVLAEIARPAPTEKEET